MAEKNLGPNLSIFGCLFGIKLVINARTFDTTIVINARTFDTTIVINAGTLAPSVANWLHKFDGILFFNQIGGHKVQHLLVTWGGGAD